MQARGVMVTGMLFCFMWMTKATSTSTGIRLQVTNKYTTKNGEAALQYPWRNDYILVEPYLTTAFEVLDSDDGIGAKYTLIVEILDKRNGDVGENAAVFFQDRKSTYVFDRVGRFKCSALKTNDDGDLVEIEEFTLLSKNVRREMRALDADDRKQMLTAMEVVYRTNTVHGKTLYGDSFRDVYWFAGIHQELGSDAICDMLHSGAGFLPSHIAFVIMFERSMQSVNPSIVAPYYEFTIDFEMYDRGGLPAMAESSVFGEDWLGPLTSTSLVLDRGRFAYVGLPLVEHDYNASSSSALTGIDPADPNVKHYYGSRMPWRIQNVYHRLRPVYTNTPFQYMTRFMDQSGARYAPTANTDCGTMVDFMKDELSFDDFVTALVNYPHGSHHTVIAGSYCPYASRVFEAANISQPATEMLLMEIATAGRNFNSLQFMHCPMDCSASSGEEEGSGSSSGGSGIDGAGPSAGGRYDGGPMLYENYLIAGGGDGCACTCPNLTRLIEEGEFEFLYYDIYSFVTNYDVIPFNETEKWVTVLRYVCNDLTFADLGGVVERIEYTDHGQPVPPAIGLTTCFPGEYRGDNSPMDPFFWVSHWTLERYYAVRLLKGFPGGRNWTSEDSGSCRSSSRDDVMPWYDLYEGDTGTAENDKRYYFGTKTNTNNANGRTKTKRTEAAAQTPSKRKSTSTSTSKSTSKGTATVAVALAPPPPGDGDSGSLPYTRTLGEIMQLLDPLVADVSPIEYVYDHFLWPHCAEDGYPVTLID